MRSTAIIVIAAVVGLAALPPGLTRLADAKRQRAAIVALVETPASRPQPVFTASAAFTGTKVAAETTLIGTIHGLALREGALVELVEPRPAPAPDLVMRHAIVSGDARAILRVVEAIEAGSPVMRLPRYRLVRNVSGQSLRLDADLVMAFSAP